MYAAQDPYPSRVGKEEEILGRLDPVVYGTPDKDKSCDKDYQLRQDQLDDFADQGFIILPDYMPEMVQPLLEEINLLKQSMSGREELVNEPESGELRSMFALHKHSQFIEQFSRHPKILNLVTQILGSDVYIMQSRLNIKPAYKGKSFPWHSDFETWHVEDGMPRMRALTAWLMLNENNEFNGPLFVVPGSHKYFVSCEGTTQRDNHKQSLRKQVAGVPRPESIDALLNQQGLKGVYGKPGTLVIHECNLLHGSPDNISPWPRSILMFVYNSVENKMLSPFGNLAARPEYLSERKVEALSPSPALDMAGLGSCAAEDYKANSASLSHRCSKMLAK